MAEPAEGRGRAELLPFRGDPARGDPAWPLPWEPVVGDRDGPLARAQALAVGGAVSTLARLPRAGQDAVAGLLARVARRLDRRHSQAARGFLEQALGPGLDPERREELVLAAWRHVLTLGLREARFEDHVPPGTLLERCEVRACPDVERVLASGAGALLVTAHVGYWEILPEVVSRLGFRPLYVVSRPPRNAPLARIAQRRRERRGYRLLHRHGAAAAVPRVLAAGGHVGMLIDQRARKKTVVAPFFGRPAHCERATAVLLRRSRAPVVFAACYERADAPYRFDVALPAVLWPEELAGEPLEALAGRINAELERMILARPEQYLWLHDRYRKAPPASPAR